MKYRSISKFEAATIRDLIIGGELYDLSQFGELIGTDEEIDMSSLIALGNEAALQCERGADSMRIEGEISPNLYNLLRNVPVSIRDDVGFWRWVTIGALLPFLMFQENPLKLESIGAGTNHKDILARRMFLRAQVSKLVQLDGTLQFDSLANLGTKNNHDFWQSHVVRLSTGAENELAQALINSHAEDRLSTEHLRAFIRDRINRPKGTIATFLMSSDDASEYIQEQREQFEFVDGTDES
jgi:hypothetical protein